MRRNIFKTGTVLCIIVLFFSLLFMGCGSSQKSLYTLEVSGVLKAAGVIDYVGLEMNVYKDVSSNPCGACADQPVSVYVGATAEEVAATMAEAITRADDIWVVLEQEGGILKLEEKKAGEAPAPQDPQGPEGLTISGSLTRTASYSNSTNNPDRV